MIDLAAVESWFSRRGWHIADFQRSAWAAYAAGESGLIHSSTGSGKTLAAWIGALLQADGEHEPLRLLWITPMRALAADTTAGLQRAAEELGCGWTVELRTGDTGSAARARQRKRLPQALVTTPESLSLLLSYADLIAQFAGLSAVIVDEWHELLGTKRGVQTELCLSRLRALAPALRVWGLSATLGNLDEAARVLVGPQREARLIAGEQRKTVRIDTVIPPKVERMAWAGHLGLPQLPQVVAELERAGTSLVFTNTRSQAERWFTALQEARPDWPMALHHGSLDTTLRREVEQGLRDGSLRAVVATSSLDLGVDFGPVEQVLQIGGPKGVARLLQRAGRSGHRPGAASRIVCVPTLALELAEFAAARLAAQRGHIEARRPLRNSLDVLAQHVVTLALTARLSADEIRTQIAGTHAYERLSDAEWRWVLDFVMRGGPALAAYPQYRKVVERDGLLHVDDATLAKRHRLAVGTIVSDNMVRVRYLRGPSLGSVEESFVARLKPGDGFTFAGRRLSLIRVRDMTAYVRAEAGTQMIPRWMGGRMPLSSELAETLTEVLAGALGDQPAAAELQALGPLLGVQRRWSRLPAPGRLLIERARSREGQHWFVYPMAGRHVHEGLSALLAWRLAQRAPLTCSFSVNDYGFELVSRELPELDAASLHVLLSPDDLARDLPASLNASEMARRRFREIARIAGLVFEGYPGAGKSVKQVQVSSGLIYDVLTRYDEGNLLTRQALIEALEQQLDYRRLAETLVRLRDSAFDIVDVERFTPLAFPLWADRLNSHQISSEALQQRIARMLEQIETAAHESASPKRRKARA
ncbi:ligase-associated DNA damage response DEXH box helicase [Hydrocarboniphaga sp.]|uniref:ligase-associated DNA damage response DEXH box helicase n=1 Tax=Hydrocarboniphaga sp. TaxID=2033016 RepID=UPI002ABA0E78|nr:ligase-associated DNA damage response DEXH box helicase [Hydrocarboniphaga sp.]MDZ4079519.1 ligase-associated DNA damage response DEXH box helicase [Hydrocarboniphaga sp.]